MGHFIISDQPLDYTGVEHNCSTQGYKSKKGVAAKRELGIMAVETPRYSPDLNPLDFSLWEEVERHTLERSPMKENETVASYKARLRRVALRLTEAVVRKAVADMRRRAQAIVDAKGGNIPRD